MDVQVNDRALAFSGILDETVTEAFFRGAEGRLKDDEWQFVDLDFSEVSRANSAGLFTLYKFLSTSKISFRFVACPPWLVDAFNLIGQLFVDSAFVQSIYVPFFCEEDETEELILFEIGKDIPLQRDYTGFIIPDRTIGDKVFEADIVPSQYLAFIANNFSKQKSAIVDSDS